ncbi:hypothetical protein [Chitinimonas taiwanensis]|uniref:Peptidoglycan-binding domain-containing protein n=1 Tax=Chitinimonas taiwanensis DSM 18899 TaxID=1121279 RepID=A0A1K2HTC2_9NEIS|nr:hypothetical protein [Chitinimonas taiwanensis]SFZ79522.1 hypothetical protein SAMN02745887_03708 [Chitinimonas taiwanensis DSM 18899]
MTTTLQVTLTPTADRTPATVETTSELSGAQWISRFPTSTSLDDLESPFKENVTSFIAALKAAGAAVTIAATRRPKERAYLMHWCFKITKGKAKADNIPKMAGVDIKWDHSDADGKYSESESIKAAKAMVSGYGMQGLVGLAPALNSRHIQGNAIDMNISWSGTLSITDVKGEIVEIATSPRTGMNETLHKVGAGYNVIKYNGSGVDKPHWSTDGR